MSKRLLIYGAGTVVGISIGLVSFSLHHDRQASQMNKFLSGQVKVLSERLNQAHGQKQEVFVLAPVGSEQESGKAPTQTDFCPVDLAICWDVVRDSEAQRKTCEKERDSTQADLKQCKRDSWITLKVFRKLKEAFGQSKGQTKQEDDNE